MASDVVVDGLTSGWTNLVAVFRKESDKTYWNGSTWEAYNASNIATYAVAATEIGSTGAYYAADPDTTLLKYAAFTRKAGADLAVSDLPNAVASGLAGPESATLVDGAIADIASAVWNAGTRTLTSFGTLVADVATAVWAAGTRTITGLTQAALALFATQDTGQTSASAGSVAKLAQGATAAVTVYPLQTTINDRIQATTIQAYVGEAGYAIGPNAVVDGNGDPVDLTAATTLRFIVTDQYGAELLNTASVTISGADDNYWTVTGTSATTLTAPASHEWALRDVTTGVNVVYGLGTLKVTPAANVSA